MAHNLIMLINVISQGEGGYIIIKLPKLPDWGWAGFWLYKKYFKILFNTAICHKFLTHRNLYSGSRKCKFFKSETKQEKKIEIVVSEPMLKRGRIIIALFPQSLRLKLEFSDKRKQEINALRKNCYFVLFLMDTHLSQHFL